MAPPHPATTTTSKALHRPTLPKVPVVLSRNSFKARLISSLPAFTLCDENVIKLHLRVQEEEAMKLLWLEEAKIREKFRNKEEELRENFRQEREASKILDGVTESLARMEIDRNLLKDVTRSQPECGVLPRKRSKTSAVDTIQDDKMQFRNDMAPYGDQSSVTPRLTFPPINRKGPNEGTKNALPVSDTRYSLFTLEQDLATSTNIEQFLFERPPLHPLTPTAENSLRSRLPISNFKTDFPGLSSTSHKIVGRSHSPGQLPPSSFFSGELDESEKENLDELAVLRQQQRQHLQQHLLFATPATATLKAKKNSHISCCSAPFSPKGRKRECDEISDDFDGDITTTTTPLMNTTSNPSASQISGLGTSSIALPRPLAYHGSQHHKPDADISMSMEQKPQAKRARLFRSPQAGLESSEPSILLRDSKGLFVPQSMIIR